MSRTARLGAFILGALILFGVGMFLIGDRQFLFSRTYRLHAPFDTVVGLDDGAVVRSGGVRVGTVDEIRMPRGPAEKITLVLKLEHSTLEVIRKDSVATIETEGLLGAKYVAVSFGSADAPPVRDGDAIASRPALDYADLAKQASAALAKADAAISGFGSIVARIERGEGTLGALVNDRRIAQDLARTVTEARAGVAAFHDDMAALKGNPLLRGFFKRRGYVDAAALTAHEIAALPRGAPLKTFVYAGKEIFDEADTAKLKNEKSLDPLGEFLETTPFGLAVVTAYTGLEGEKDKNLELTRARSMVVREFLAKRFRVDDARIKTKGMGEDARTDSKKASRVEVLVYPRDNAAGAARAR